MSLKKKLGLFLTAFVMLLGAQKLTAEEGEADPGLYICSAQFKQYETWGLPATPGHTSASTWGECGLCVNFVGG